MIPIGGYFELELRKGEEYHQEAIRINTGRNALEYILLTRKYSGFYIPYYTCEVILEPLKKLNITCKFYSIDNNFEPIFDYDQIKDNEGFLFTNYFGLKDNFINKLYKRCRNLVIDNAQSFYSKPVKGVDTFYSARKFFGVPDGAYLFLKGAEPSGLPLDVSLDKMSHLLKRIELGAEAGYNDFKINDKNLTGLPIMQMSKLTSSLLCNIDYEFIKKRRRENFLILNQHLAKYNKLEIISGDHSVPMVYPFLTDNAEIKNRLIENKIFVATYWSNVLNIVRKDSFEYRFVNNLIPLPIDQRIEQKDLCLIIRNIEKYL